MEDMLLSEDKGLQYRITVADDPVPDRMTANNEKTVNTGTVNAGNFGTFF
jgi:hypothetical protein